VSDNELKSEIEQLWARRSELGPGDGDAQKVVHQAIELLDRGEARIAEPSEDAEGGWSINEWLRQAVNLLFPLSAMETTELGPFEYRDKIPLKRDYESQSVRVVPGASARWGAHLSPGVILMPSYVNIGAWVGHGTMVDTWATVGSCAQIGANVHLSGGVGIGGVLEPPGAKPVIVEDDCVIGSRCMLVDGARVGRGSFLGAGVVLSPSIPVIDAQTGDELGRGVVPPWSLVVQATRPREFAGGTFGLACALVIRKLEEGERHDKGQLNAILREHGATA
jgi:2,3,4,5-tetrahydropyridine-2,6-dicarboxylate N-succinyltransferase